jgi:uncharacterized protein
MLISEQHPYYVNSLCDEIWSGSKCLPNQEKIIECWDYIVEGEKSNLIKDFLNLSDNQKKVIRHIVNSGSEDIYSKKSLQNMDIQSSSLGSALTVLEQADFIEKNGKKYNLIVPVYKKLIKYV